MKQIKKMMALALALIMTLSMGMTVFAEGEVTEPEKAYDYPITVTGLSTNPADQTVNFYKVIEWVGETSDHSDVSGWKAVSTYSSVLTKDVLTEVLVGRKATQADVDAHKAEKVGDQIPATGITSELAGELAKLAANGTPATKIENGVATLENADSGMWMALVTPADANTIYNPVFVSADYDKEHAGTVAMTDTFNGDAVAKKSTLTLTKTASTTPEDTNDDGKSTTTAVGDTVTFTVTTTLPAYGNVYDNPHFVLTDNLDAMELKADAANTTAGGYDIVVAGVPATYKDADNQDQPSYTIAPAADKKSYTITFAAGYLKTLKAAVTGVTVTYKAIVTSDASKAVNEEDNTVKIEYSHNPNQQNDYDVKKDTTQHYTFTLDASGIGESESTTIQGKKTSELVKIGLDAAGNPITSTRTTSEIGDPKTDYVTGPLAGAKFGLFTDAAGTVPYKAKNADGTAGTTAMEATTGPDGRMTFAGLDAGTYYLKEISAPAGYVTNTTVHTVVITATTKSVEVTEYWDGENKTWVSEQNDDAEHPYKSVTYDTDILESYTVTIDGDTVAEYQFKNPAKATSTEINWEEAELVEHPHSFENTKGVELPSTGGIGTTLFYVFGAILVLGAGVILVTRRRMNAN